MVLLMLLWFLLRIFLFVLLIFNNDFIIPDHILVNLAQEIRIRYKLTLSIILFFNTHNLIVLILNLQIFPLILFINIWVLLITLQTINLHIRNLVMQHVRLILASSDLDYFLSIWLVVRILNSLSIVNVSFILCVVLLVLLNLHLVIVHKLFLVLLHHPLIIFKGI